MALISDKIVPRGKPKETSKIGEAPAYRHSEVFQNREPKESAWHISLLTPVLEYGENSDCSYSLK